MRRLVGRTVQPSEALLRAAAGAHDGSPSLFLAKLAELPARCRADVAAAARGQICRGAHPLLYSMRRAFEGVWRAFALDDEKAPQLAAPQWQLLLHEHVESCELAVRHAHAAAKAAALTPPADWAAAPSRARAPQRGRRRRRRRWRGEWTRGRRNGRRLVVVRRGAEA